jgi:fibronectin type 3 domain-containing protein
VGSFTISAIAGSLTAAPNSTGNTASFTAAGATKFAWQITNGTITAGQGTNSITYTAGASGTVTLRATAYNSTMCGVTDTKAVVIGSAIAAPTGVNAIATTPTNIHVTWNSVTGASNYQVYRNDGMSGYQPTGSPTSSLSFDDTVTTNKSYLYVVQSIDAGSNHSGNSTPDFATAIIFTNNLTGAVIKAVDLNELRTAVAAMRVLANQGSTTFANPTITPGVTVINAVDITELRTFLNNARTTMGFGTVTFSRPITQQSTTVAAVDFTEIRGGVQ